MKSYVLILMALLLLLAVTGCGQRHVTIQQAPSITVYATKTGECYHQQGCTSLRKSKIPLALDQAVARGLRPCSNCRPPIVK